jgi:hypothetical protein
LDCSCIGARKTSLPKPAAIVFAKIRTRPLPGRSVPRLRAGFRIGAAPIPTLYNAPGSHIHPMRDTVRFIRFVWRHLWS